MKITHLQLRNWCQYSDNHLFSFGSDPGRNVVLIHADNDVGKSSIFYSIAWCLHEQMPPKWEQKKWPLHPIPWERQAKAGEEIKTEVSITFTHGEHTFCVTRSFRAQKTKTDVVIADRQFTVQRKQPNGNWVSDNESILHRVLPKSVLGYFIFDAETLEHFVHQSDNVQNSVRRLLDIEDAERGLQHLNSVSEALRKDFSRKKSNREAEIQLQIDRLNTEIEAGEKELNDPANGLHAKIQLCRTQRKQIEQQLHEFKPIRDLLKEEQSIQDRLDRNAHDISAARKRLKALSGQLYIGFAHPIVKKAVDFLDEKRRKGELPKYVKKPFVDERIRERRCICGAELADGSAAMKEICSFRDSLSDELSEISDGLRGHLLRFLERARSRKGEVRDAITMLDTLTKDEQALKESKKAVSTKIQKRDGLPDVEEYQRKKEHLETLENEYTKEITRLEGQLADKNEQRETQKQLLKFELKKLKESSAVEKQYIFATSASEALHHAIQKFKARAREFLEKQCNLMGERLFWREDVYRIEITEDYQIRVKSKLYGEDRDVLAGISMGATQMTGMALITALAKQTQAQAPLIMDTPFARLSPAHITRALAECPKYFEQWILFLQPSEWRDADYRKVVQPHIQKEFTLSRLKGSEITSVHEGYRQELFGKLGG